MGKVTIGHYCYLTADILTRVLQKCSLSSPLPNILFLSKSLNLIGFHSNRKSKFPTKIIPSEAIRGIKAEALQKYLLDWCFIAVGRMLSLLWQLKFSVG